MRIEAIENRSIEPNNQASQESDGCGRDMADGLKNFIVAGFSFQREFVVDW
jgi:hypothetical protein